MNLGQMLQFIVGAAALFAFAACSRSVPEQPVSPSSGGAELALESQAWELEDRIPGTRVDIEFREGKLSGHGGVNRYFGDYRLDGTALEIGQIGSTMMAGPREVMDQEQRFLGKLSQIAAYSIVGSQLRFMDREGKVVLVLVPRRQVGLTSVEWKATGLNNGRGGVVSVLGDTELTARFDAAGILSGLAGCNNYTGAYETEGVDMTVRTLARTRKMCNEPDGVMEQEEIYIRALEGAARYRIDSDILELRNAGGSLLVRFSIKQ
jgi:heat shock protein HslJ